ncbi:hypothetical protein V8E36_004755 [Tilletia maclaganii]
MPGVALSPARLSADASPEAPASSSGSGSREEEVAPSPADALRLTVFGRWYPFHRRHAPKATIINLAEVQPDFIAWLESGSFVLREDPSSSGHGQSEPSSSTARIADQRPSDEVQEEEEEGEDDALPPPSFPRLHSRLQELIQKYDGAVFPKLNWSAPRDAAWIVPGATLRCTSAQDIYLLLKSSDFVATDIAQARELYLPAQASSITVDLEAASTAHASSAQSLPPLPLILVIKQHYAFPTSHEFRCFVHRRRLIALSQRDTATAFPHLLPARTRRKIRKLVHGFWREHLDLPPPSPSQEERQQQDPGLTNLSISDSPTSSGPLHSPTALLRDYVFDVYLTRDMSRVFLVDLAPWGTARTDPLLWNWDELEQRSERESIRASAGDQERDEADDLDEDDDEEEEGDDEDEEQDKYDADERLPPLRVLSSDPSPSSDSSPSAQTTASSHTFSNTPTYAHNMVPADFHALASASSGPEGAGKTLEQLREEWAAAVARASVDDGDESD